MTALRFANAVLMVVFTLSALALIYVGLDERHVPVLFYVAPALVMIVAAASLKRPPAARINISLVIASVAFVAYAGELLLSTGLVSALAGADGHLAPNGVDRRTKLQVVQDLRARGIDAYPAALPLHFVRSDSYNGSILPLGGVANVTTVLCNELGYYSVYNSDEHGFNNPKGLWTSDSLAVAVAGDSFTHGSCVLPGDDVASGIRKQWPHTISLGMSNDGPMLVLATIREYLPALRPDRVVWMYYEGNDLSDIADEKDHAMVRSYFEPGFSQGLLRRQGEVDSVLKSWIARQQQRAEKKLGDGTTPADLKGIGAVVYEARSFLTLKHIRESFQLVASPAASSDTCDLRTFQQALDEGNKTVSSWGGQLYLAYLPSWGRYNAQLNRCEEMREEVVAAATALGVPVIDIHDAFERHGKPRELFAQSSYFTHLSVRGYALVAQTVIESLQRHVKTVATSTGAHGVR